MRPHSGINGGIIMLKKSPFKKINFVDFEIPLLDTNVAIIQETNKNLKEKLRSKLHIIINVNDD